MILYFSQKLPVFEIPIRQKIAKKRFASRVQLFSSTNSYKLFVNDFTSNLVNRFGRVLRAICTWTVSNDFRIRQLGNGSGCAAIPSFLNSPKLVCTIIIKSTFKKNDKQKKRLTKYQNGFHGYVPVLLTFL